MKVGKIYQILFLWFVVLGVFYPAVFAGVNSVDDWRMFYTLESLSKTDLWSFFHPTSGFYYRPLLMLSFVVDYRLWGNEPGFFHLGNILLHAANVSLVYLLSWQLQKMVRKSDSSNYWPLLTALLFAVHPIVTESVDWISGRTDLMGGMFALLATLFLMVGIQRVRLWWMLSAVGALACAIMSKEVMVFFLPAAAYLFWRYSTEQEISWRRKALGLLTLPFVVSGLVYFGLRVLSFGTGSGFSSLLDRYHYGAFDTIRVFFKVLGFYSKKMIAPLPLNFAIVSAADVYAWVGVAVLLLVVLLFFMRRPETDLFVVSFILITPGILIALTNVAWTPLAERYIYLPTIFFVLAVGCALSSASENFPMLQRGTVLCVLLLLPMTVVTVQRNIIWQDNALLYADSIKKSPEFAAMNNELAIALIDSGDLTQAEEVLDKGKTLRSASPLLYINQARIFLQRGDFQGARKEMLGICTDKSTANLEALKMLAKIDEKRLWEEGFDAVAKNLIDTYTYIIQRGADPYYDYRLGQILLKIGDKEGALHHFTVASDRSSSDSYYVLAAQKFVKRLTLELGQ